MRTRHSICSILALLASLPSAAVAVAQAPAPSAQPRQGEVRVEAVGYPGTSVKMGRGTGPVEAPYERVVKILQDYAGYVGFIPNFSASRVLSRRGSRALVYVEAEAAHGAITLWAQLKFKSQQDSSNTHRIVATMVKGNVTEMYATWTVKRLGPGRALVTFEVMMDPDLPLPNALVSHENEKAARNTMKALQKLVQRPPH